MKERPILFSEPMVRAILGERKTQTRRAVRGPGPDTDDIRFDLESNEWYCERGLWHMKCPLGNPGDELWVRETWQALSPSGYETTPVYGACTIEYRANETSWGGRWKSSLFMPRWASRITLKILIRGIERLQDISPAGAKAEGITQTTLPPTKAIWFTAHPEMSDADRQSGKDPTLDMDPVGAFKKLWEGINPEGPKAWDENPWVWVICFKLV